MSEMNTNGKSSSKPFFLGILPKCPFYKPIPILIILVLISFGTWGIYYFNKWIALVYFIFSILWYFLIMPFTLCKCCYFKVTEIAVDEESGKTIKKLVSVEKWREMDGIEKHVGQKNWTYCMSLIWFLPIVLILISFFKDFSIFALVSLIGFLGTLVGNYYYMLRIKCPTCAIREDCHSAF